MSRANAKAHARDLYARDGLALGSIAARLGVSERTVSRWKAEDAARGAEWDKARATAALGRESIEATTQGLLLEFLTLHRRTLDEVNASADMTTAERVAAISSLTDAYVKQMKACGMSAPHINRLAVATDVIGSLTRFVAEKRPAAGPALLEVLEAFGPELAKEYA